MGLFSCGLCASAKHRETIAKMQNEAGEYVDLYSPRKCSASNRIIPAKDHGSVQINIAEVDPETGLYTGSFKTFAICGNFREMGESDDSINRLSIEKNLISKSFNSV